MIEDERKIFFVIDKMTDLDDLYFDYDDEETRPQNQSRWDPSNAEDSDVVVDGFLSERTWMFIDRERSQLDPPQPSSISHNDDGSCGMALRCWSFVVGKFSFSSGLL